MDTVTRTAFLAKPEAQRAVSQLREELVKALPEGSFAEREAAMLVVLGEAGRGFIEQELQAFSFDGKELKSTGAVKVKGGPAGIATASR